MGANERYIWGCMGMVLHAPYNSKAPLEKIKGGGARKVPLYLTLTVNSKIIHLQQVISLLLNFPRIIWLTLLNNHVKKWCLCISQIYHFIYWRDKNLPIHGYPGRLLDFQNSEGKIL